MGWLDEWLTDLGATAPIAPPIAKPRQPKAEIRSVWFQTRQPRDAEDPGGCEAGFYSVSDGVLTMRDEKGKPTGSAQRLGQGDNEKVIASRLAKQAWSDAVGESDFNRQLNYQPLGIA